MFYTNGHQVMGQALVSGRNDDGSRFLRKEEIVPEVFMRQDEKSSYKNSRGEWLRPLTSKGFFDARSKIKEYEEAGMELFYNKRWLQAHLHRNYHDQVVDTQHIKIGYIDIETECENGMPDPYQAVERINAISLSHKSTVHVFGLQKVNLGGIDSTYKKSIYYECDDERDLLKRFIAVWQRLELDVVTGWNIQGFDIPFIINRINRLFGDDAAKSLSPWEIVEEKEDRDAFGNDVKIYTIVGLTVIDYLLAYKKFRKANEESFKLDYICNLELGVKKIDYSEFGGKLHLLYQNDYQKFIEYNIRDTELVQMLEKKIKILELIFVMSYDGMVTYSNTFGSVILWDCMISNYLRERGIIIPGTRKKTNQSTKIVGGWVKEPVPGLYRWLVTVDATSMYPSEIMQFNISPDSKVVDKERLEIFNDLISHHEDQGNADVCRILKTWKDGGIVDLDDIIKLDTYIVPTDRDYSITAKGIIFKHQVGFMKAMVVEKFNNRAKFKKKMLEEEVMVELLENRIKELEAQS